jgi:hypothetical protein
MLVDEKAWNFYTKKNLVIFSSSRNALPKCILFNWLEDKNIATYDVLISFNLVYFMHWT